jgi:serine protease Do
MQRFTKVLGLLLPAIVWSMLNQTASFAGEDFPGTTIVKVRAYHPHGKFTAGSAVLLGADRLVTNCHVTTMSQEVEIIHHGQVWRTEPGPQNPTHDLCILSAPGVTGTKAAIAKQVSVGQKVFAAGFFAGDQLAVSEGRVVALHDYDGVQVIQVTSPFDFGASGGGLFDEQGRLIGVLTFKARAGGAFHFALPAALLSDLDRPGRERSADATLAFWQQAPEKQPFFLRAMSLELNQKWDALAAVGEAWTKQSPTNPRAWIALETAFRHLQRQEDATVARGEAQRLGCAQVRHEPLPPNAAPVIYGIPDAACAGQSFPVGVLTPNK